MIQLITVIFIVLLSSALCSGTEAALLSVPLVKARQLAQSHKQAGKALLTIRENIGRPIATIVILNNIANIVGSIVVGSIATKMLGSQWLGVVTGTLTFLVILFSEIIPKTVGERYAEKISLWTAQPVLALTYALTPLLWLTEKVTSPLTKGDVSPTTNETEITFLTKIGQQEGIIEKDESEMIQLVFKLNDVTAADLMSPRIVMTHLPGNLTLAEAKESAMASQHSRIVITGESVDDVVGVALKNELLIAIIEQKDDQLIADLAHEALLVPDTIRSNALLKIFQQSRQHLAVVIDEFGGVSGVISLEDVLETLTGEIVDETDEVVDMQEAARKYRREIMPNEKYSIKKDTEI